MRGRAPVHHASGEHDDRAVTLALGCHHLLEAPGPSQPARFTVGAPETWLPEELRGNVLAWED